MRRVRIIRSSNAVDVVILPKPDIADTILRIGWLVFWYYGESFGIRQSLSGELIKGDDGLRISAAFLLWTVFGLLVIRGTLWNLFGRETLSIDGEGLIIRREVLTLGFSRRYGLRSMHDVGVVPARSAASHLLWGADMPFVNGGRVGFKVDDRSHRLGIGIGDADANRILDLIRDGS